MDSIRPTGQWASGISQSVSAPSPTTGKAVATLVTRTTHSIWELMRDIQRPPPPQRPEQAKLGCGNLEAPSELVLTYIKIMWTLGKKGTERSEGVPVHLQGRYPQGLQRAGPAGAAKALWLSKRERELEQVQLPGLRNAGRQDAAGGQEPRSGPQTGSGFGREFSSPRC